MSNSSDATVVGLISDTHGLLRASVHEALKGVSLILHAGDVGGADILDELRMIAPVQAVYGNILREIRISRRRLSSQSAISRFM